MWSVELHVAPTTTRHLRFVKPRLHDTTGWMFVYTIQPFVKLVWQPCWTNSCSYNTVVKPGCTTGWMYTRYNRLSNRFDNRLYRVNGALFTYKSFSTQSTTISLCSRRYTSTAAGLWSLVHCGDLNVGCHVTIWYSECAHCVCTKRYAGARCTNLAWLTLHYQSTEQIVSSALVWDVAGPRV